MINRQRLINLFTHLVSIDSPSGQERDICDNIKLALSALSIEYYEDNTGSCINGNAGNLYAYVDGEIDLPPLLFSAHMDTVEPARRKKAILHTDGKITSDGSSVLGADDLSGVVSILEALHTIKENGILHRPLELLFTVSEETYCTGARYFDYSKIKAKEAYVLDLSGPIGHASNRAPTILSFQVNFYGRAAHAAFAPEDGAHAIKAAASAVSEIECGQVGETTVNIGKIQGGTANNIIPDNCSFTGEIRSFSDEAAQSMLSYIELVSEKKAGKCGTKMKLTYDKHLTAYLVESRNPVIRRFQNVCRYLGIPSSLRDTYGGSDNHHLVNNGINGIVIASGMNACHSTNEYTTTEDLVQASELTLALMLSRD